MMTKKNDSHRRSRGEDKHQESAPTPTAESAESGPAAAAPSAANPAAESAEPAAVPTTSAPPPEDQQLLRLRADFENYRKRVLRERDELYQRANADLITELLPTLDHLDIAFAAVEVGSDDPVVQGFRLVGEQMRGVLGRFGLKTVDAEGQPFDHNIHEAIAQVPSPDVPENHVVAQTRRGYLLGERLLRAAQVVVSSGAPEA